MYGYLVSVYSISQLKNRFQLPTCVCIFPGLFIKNRIYPREYVFKIQKPTCGEQEQIDVLLLVLAINIKCRLLNRMFICHWTWDDIVLFLHAYPWLPWGSQDLHPLILRHYIALLLHAYCKLTHTHGSLRFTGSSPFDISTCASKHVNCIEISTGKCIVGKGDPAILSH